MEQLLEVKNLKKYFPIKGGIFLHAINHVKAVDGVDLTFNNHQTLGVVGESGCGKSTLGRVILRLQEATEGEIIFENQDIRKLKHNDLIAMRRNMQIIFQDPFASLNPRMTVLEIIKEPLDVHNVGEPKLRRDKVIELMNLVGLRPQVMHRYPHEFSGGQRQRIGIARALALNPKFVVADEPVSALDVSIQSQVLNLIKDLQEKLGLAFMFIAHDLAVIQHISHEVAVMYLGKIVEKAKTEDLYKDPLHPYTIALLSAIPVPDPKHNSSRIVLSGDVPSPINPPSGCRFNTRCPEVMDICKTKEPELMNMGTSQDHLVACHLYPKQQSTPLD